MTTEDLTGPIPTVTFRISVRWGDDRLAQEVAAGKGRRR
jgi:hypothetical protein